MKLRALVALVLVVAPLAACRDRQEAKNPATVPIGQSTRTITVDGRAREYRIFRPDSLPAKASVVLMFHGGFGSAEQAEKDYGWDELAQREHVLLVYPNGVNHAWAVGGGCCGTPGSTGVDDVSFVKVVVAEVRKLIPVDDSRIYATGMSNGALMSYRLACDTKLFAAVAPVAGTILGSCDTPSPVSLIHIHGLADENIPFDGSPGNGFAKIDGPPVPEVVAKFRALDGCPEPTVSKVDVVTTSIANFPNGRAVELITVDGAGHQWPGSDRKRAAGLIPGIDPPSTAFDATDVIWKFFADHPIRS